MHCLTITPWCVGCLITLLPCRRWLRPDGKVALEAHPSMKSSFSGEGPIRGAGLRLAFPRYRDSPDMAVDDGFANRLPWEVVAAVSTCLGPCLLFSS